MNIEFVNRSGRAMPKVFLTKWLKACVKTLSKKDQRRLKDKELWVVFVSRGEMKKLNFQFRGKNYPTDVLSFEPVEEDSLGEIVMSPDVLEVQGRRMGLSFRRELGYMVLHGLLHLLGYDHETSTKEAKIMFALQDRIFHDLAGWMKFR